VAFLDLGDAPDGDIEFGQRLFARVRQLGLGKGGMAKVRRVEKWPRTRE